MRATFVWMPGSRKPQPQLWYGTVKKIEKDQPQPLSQHVLKDHELQLSLTELVELYPAPGAPTARLK